MYSTRNSQNSVLTFMGKEFFKEYTYIQLTYTYGYILACLLVWSLSGVWLFATPWTIACQVPLSMGILQARILEWVAMLSSEDLSNPGIEPRSFTSQADSSPSEPPGRPKNTGMDSLSLQEGNFLTLELNQVILHCRKILYHLNYQGCPTGHNSYQ